MLYFLKGHVEPNIYKRVYVIRCCRGKVYIGEISHSIKTRLKEHITYTHNGRIKKYSILERSRTSNHPICLEDSRVLAKVPHEKQ